MYERRLKWDGAKAYLGDILFRVERDNSLWDGGDEYLRLWKDQKLVSQYEQFFAERPNFKAERLFEIGMFDGGSVLFWHDFFGPSKHVAIDIAKPPNNPYLAKCLREGGRDKRVRTFWSTDQADAPRLRQLARDELGGPIDVVIDDASHLYGFTKRSFETLFPQLRPGGLYIIEDWAWAHWPDQWPVFSGEATPLTQIVFDLVEAVGTSRDWISRVTVFQGFTVIERGPAAVADRADWTLANHTLTMPPGTPAKRAIVKLKAYARQSGKKMLTR